MSTLPKYVSQMEVADMLGTTTRTVNHLVRNGRLPQPVRLGRIMRFERTELLAFLASKPDIPADTSRTIVPLAPATDTTEQQ